MQKIKLPQRIIKLNISSKKDAQIVKKAIEILNKIGITLCNKTDLVLESEMDKYIK